MSLTIKRVPYGKESTPIEDREYRMGFGPVGTIVEWKKELQNKGYDKLKIVELDGSEREEKL